MVLQSHAGAALSNALDVQNHISTVAVLVQGRGYGFGSRLPSYKPCRRSQRENHVAQKENGNEEAFALGVLACLVPTLTLGFVWHLILFKQHYEDLAIYQIAQANLRNNGLC